MTKVTLKRKGSIEPPLVAPLGTQVRRRESRTGQIARRLLLAGLIVAVCLRLGAIAVQPITAGYRASREIRLLEAEYRQVRERNQHLQRLAKHLNTPAGVEEEARRLGWVRTGERPIRVIVDGPELQPGPTTPPPPVAVRPPASAPAPARAAIAERIQQKLATWSATRWIGSLFGGRE